MTNRIFLFSATLVVVVLSSFSFNNYTAADAGADQSLPAFNAIDVAGCWNVHVTHGESTSIRFEGPQAEIDKIEYKVKDEKLIIRKKIENDKCSSEVEIFVSMNLLKGIALAGSGSVILENTFTENHAVDISLAGSGSVKGTLSAPDIDADLAGSGNITLQGEAKSLDLDLAGSGEFNGASLLIDNAEVELAGSGNATLHVNTRLEVEIAGSGNIYYTGKPVIVEEIAGSGKLVSKN